MSSRAPLVAGWGRTRSKRGSMLPTAIPGPMNPAGNLYAGDSSGGNIQVGAEIYLGALGWVDISPYIYYRDGSTKVSITRGRPDESSGSVPPPQTCAFQLNNRSLRFSPRNPTGPWYRLIGRNTPIRFWRMQNGQRRYRYAGEVPAWPSTTDISGKDVYTSVTAAGRLRRAGQGTPPVESVMYRSYTRSSVVPNVVAYWPCEDGSSASQIAAGFPGDSPMTVAGTPTFASNSAFACSRPLPVIAASQWQGSVSASSWTDNVLRFLLQVPSGGDTNGAVIARFTTSGTVKRVDLVYNTTAGGELTLKGFDAGGSTLFTLGPFLSPSGAGWNGALCRISMELDNAGSNVTYQFQAIEFNLNGVAVASGSLAGSVGSVNTVTIDPAGNLSGTTVGHISVQNVADSLADLGDALDVHNFDSAPQRLERLCAEQGVNLVSVYGDDADEASLMGNQTPDTFLNLVKSCVDVDAGMLFEARDQVAFAYRQRWTLYNQGTRYSLSPFQLTLDYAQNQLSAVPVPTDDDLLTRNDVTVQQSNSNGTGTSARQVLDDGTALSVSDPPVGVGQYQTTYPLNIGNDGLFVGQSSIADEAGWRLHLGTVDEARYPRVSVNLRHPAFQGNLDLMNAALSVDIGDLIVINNPDGWIGADPVRLLIIGMSEVMGAFEHDIVFTCVPESAYRVFVADDWVLGRADTDGSTLGASAGSTDSVLTFTAADVAEPWTVSPGDFPFDVGVGGERITVVSPVESYANDPFLSAGLAHYSGNNASLSLDSGRPFPTNLDNVLNPYAPLTIKVTPTGTTNVSVVSDNYLYVDTPFNANYSAWVWVYSETGRQYQCFINWADNTGTYLSTSFGTAMTLPVGVWTLLATGAQTRPAGAVNLSIGVVDTVGSPSASQTFNCWGFNAVHTLSLASAGASQPYKVIRSVNGVVKTQAAGQDVRLWQPPILGL